MPRSGTGKKSKSNNAEASERTNAGTDDRIDSQQAHDSDGEVPERDFATEDNGVPRADWNEEGARESARGEQAQTTKSKRRPRSTR